MNEHEDSDRTAFLDRRRFLARAAAAGTGLPFAVQALARPASRPARPRCIHLFSKHLQWLDYDGMADVAAEIGFDGADANLK